MRMRKKSESVSKTKDEKNNSNGKRIKCHEIKRQNTANKQLKRRDR
jgi:hypothetical protein